MLVWPSIESCLDFETTAVVLPRTSRRFRAAVMDTESGKAKVSHFDVRDSVAPLRSHWASAPRRIPHFVSRSLNAIHLPSLERLDLEFTSTKLSANKYIEDSHSSAFPILAMNLASMTNLCELKIDVGKLISRESSGELDGMYGVFGDNLMKCHKLKRLAVFNKLDQENASFYSVRVTKALVRGIREQRDVLEEITLSFGDWGVSETCENIPTIAQELFTAVLSCRNLKKLAIQIEESQLLLNALFFAVKTVFGHADESSLLSLEKLHITHTREKNEETQEDADSPMASFLPFFTGNGTCTVTKQQFYFSKGT